MKSLLELQSYYETELCDRVFQYMLKGDTMIRVRFFRESFCHLLGIQHILRDKRTLGKKGWESIQRGTLSIQKLKKLDKAAFKSAEQRIANFDKIDLLMRTGDIYRFYPQRAAQGTKISADFLLYARDLHLFLHLFLVKEHTAFSDFAPVSYIPLSEKDRFPERYVMRQERKTILAAAIVPDAAR